MPEVDYVNQQYIVKYLIDNPVISNPYPVTVSAFKLFIAWWTRISRQASNGFYNRFRCLIGQFIKLFLRFFK